MKKLKLNEIKVKSYVTMTGSVAGGLVPPPPPPTICCNTDEIACVPTHDGGVGC